MDLLLLIEDGLAIDRDLVVALRRTFSPAGRDVPGELPRPPESWRQDFEDMVHETGLAVTGLEAAHERMSAYWERVCEVLDDGATSS